MRKKLFYMLAAFILLSTASAWAGEGDVKIDQWTGKEFIFLALPQDDQANGYAVYPQGTSEASIQNSSAPRLPYALHQGKHLLIDEVKPLQVGQEEMYVVNMTEKETGMKLTAQAFRAQVDGLAFAEDLAKARSEFVGKTVYARKRTLIGHPIPNTIVVPLGQPMKVKDVWPGFQTAEPLLLVVECNGGTAVAPFAYSWTNQISNSWTGSPAWQRAFFASDPRSIADNSTAVWDLIAESCVQKGMTTEQVRLSWGPPESSGNITKDKMPELLWRYGKFQLHFVNNVLCSVEKKTDEKPDYQVVDDAVINSYL